MAGWYHTSSGLDLLARTKDFQQLRNDFIRGIVLKNNWQNAGHGPEARDLGESAQKAPPNIRRRIEACVIARALNNNPSVATGSEPTGN